MKIKGIGAVLATAGLTAGIALSACGGSSAPATAHSAPTVNPNNDWYVDSSLGLVVEVSNNPSAAGLAMPDGTTVQATHVQPNTGNFAATCTYQFDNAYVGVITWRVYDTSSSPTQSAASQTMCAEIDRMSS